MAEANSERPPGRILRRRENAGEPVFSRLKNLFPGAKFIAIVRDPRDVITSAWHFFHKAVPGEDEIAAKTAFIAATLPVLAESARYMIAFCKDHPDDYRTVTYEQLREAPVAGWAALFRFLGVPDDADITEDCVARTSFAAQSGRRDAGIEQNGSFFRKGAMRDCATTLMSAMEAMIMQELGWMYPHFGLAL